MESCSCVEFEARATENMCKNNGADECEKTNPLRACGRSGILWEESPRATTDDAANGCLLDFLDEQIHAHVKFDLGQMSRFALQAHQQTTVRREHFHLAIARSGTRRSGNLRAKRKRKDRAARNLSAARTHARETEQMKRRHVAYSFAFSP